MLTLCHPFVVETGKVLDVEGHESSSLLGGPRQLRRVKLAKASCFWGGNGIKTRLPKLAGNYPVDVLIRKEARLAHTTPRPPGHLRLASSSSSAARSASISSGWS